MQYNFLASAYEYYYQVKSHLVLVMIYAYLYKFKGKGFYESHREVSTNQQFAMCHLQKE